MQLLAISGSLRAQSLNTALIEAVSLCAPAEVAVERFRGLGELPLFNPDLEEEGQVPPPVAALRDLVAQCDAMLICSPEYARGVSGPMKNGLDWLVGSLEFPGKPVAIVNASQRATIANANIRLTLETMDAFILEDACLTVPLLGRQWTAMGILDDSALRPVVIDLVDRIQRAVANLARPSPDRASSISASI